MKVEIKKVITLSKEDRYIIDDLINALDELDLGDYEILEAIHNRNTEFCIDDEKTILIKYE